MANRLHRVVALARAFSTTSSAFVTRSCSPSLVQKTSPSANINQPYRWLSARFNSHWLVTMDFPDPQTTREEKIATFERTCANVVGSMEEAKKKIYVVSTTNYTGFKCEISEGLAQTMEKQPGVKWVLPDCYADPQYRPYGPGDRYNNGVITPDPNAHLYNRPSEGYNDRPMNRRRDPLPSDRNDRRRDFPAMDGRGQDYRVPPMGSGRGPMSPQDQQHNRSPMDGRGPISARDRQDIRPPMDGRGPLPPRNQQDYRPPMAERGPMQGERRDYMPSREPMQGKQEDAMGSQGRDPVQGTN